MKLIFGFLIVLCSFTLSAQPGIDTLKTKVLQPVDMQADFRYLRRLLEETHPGLYRYTSKPIMQAKLDSIAATLTNPLPFYEFYKTIEALIADIRCAHTHSLPTKNWQKLFVSHWKTLPFFLFPVQNHSYVLFNGTTDQRIKPGFDLLRINGQSMDSIRQVFYRHHWADGYNQTSKQAAFQGQLFALFYYWFIDQPDTFRLTFRSLTGDSIQVDVPAQTFSGSMSAYKKNPVNTQMLAWYGKNQSKHPWRLSFLKDTTQTAYLRIDSFGGKGANSSETAAARFRTFMDESLAKIEKKKARHLIIDLRSNPGGWDIQGVELFTYLMKSDSAVRYYAQQHTVTDRSEFLKFSDLSADDLKNVKNELIPEKDGTFTVKEDDNSRELKLQYPKPNRFKGQVYMLMNGRSGSTTSEFLAVAHANRIGTFVGEESGGAYEGGNGGSFVHLELPHSRIYVGTPLVYYNNAVGKPTQTGRGTMPDYDVPISIDTILNHTDNQLEFIKKLIRDSMGDL
ncbi:peptidase S41 [Spirosoma aureum]|uniref:Peptidase S41 n=1 Tax=Spirosoma aureum TaxID=2692134 RepID=A0A6G9AIE9_9BACT|nr:S41 family peptidase [Spirosoma aureum]QIP12086.1 peptidase S41 [Spirosoma aureum]